MKRVAVIGGGIFGSTAAIYAARAGHDVHLYEKKSSLLQAASGINQYRLHRGYHYPRSPETARSAAESETSFREEYGEAVVDGGRHLYGIAREGSRVSPEAYRAFCDSQGLTYREVDGTGIVDVGRVPLLIEAVEARYDPVALRELVENKLTESGVSVHLNTGATRSLADEYDAIIIAAYAQTNVVSGMFTDSQEKYQFEVCEKPVVRMPERFARTDLVIMDGPFMCVDPLGDSGLFVLGNVVHAIHATNVGFVPEIPKELEVLLDSGIVKDPVHSRFSAFVEDGARFIPSLEEAEHVGSLFTVRTVLPNLDSTDARPTLVTSLNERVIKIFSGKVGNCVEAARKVVALL
jgi:hypothetical protein